MTDRKEGNETLDVRKMWKHEALDFTPWLADNLNLLGEELSIGLELVQQEKAMGPMSLDILAKDTDTGELVAIENQLEWAGYPPSGPTPHLRDRMGLPRRDLGGDRVQARVRPGPEPA